MSADASGASSWIVIPEGLVGCRNQAIGLAEALGLPYVVKEAKKTGSLWQRLFRHFPEIAPPWPDILISCGRRSIPVSLAVRKANRGKTFTVHIQDPHIDPRNFDALIVPEHDRLRGGNVFVTCGAVHRVTIEKLERAAAQFQPVFSSLPRPLISVLVGGAGRHQQFSSDSLCNFAEHLREAAVSTGGSLAVTPSRRTGAALETLLKNRLEDVDSYVWNHQGENPYFGLLGLADAIVVTSDSVSMVSEACFTGKPVYVYVLPDRSRRRRRFLEDLIQRGIVRPFSGQIETWQYEPFDETRRAAAFVRAELQKKTAGAV